MKLAFGCLIASTLSAGTITYDAALGSLPTSQGFVLTDTTASGPAPFVSGGLLRQGPTPAAGVQYWLRSGLAADFATGYVELTARLRILSSPLFAPDPGAGFRTGFGIYVSDIIGNTFVLALSDEHAIVTREYDAVFLNTLDAPCNCTQTRTFRVLAGGGESRLWIDGVLMGTVPLLLNASSLNPAVDGLLFGDPTSALGSQSEIEFISVRTVAIPEPSTAVLLAPIAVLVWFARRRIVATRHPISN